MQACSSCTSELATEAPLPAESEPAESEPSSGSAESELSRALDEIDRSIKNTMEGNISYNVPAEIILEDTIKLQLLISPSMSKNELSISRKVL
jgi:hypothetical protein